MGIKKGGKSAIKQKDCIIVYKNDKGIALRATRITVENADGMVAVYNGDDLTAIVPLAEIKTVVFVDCGDYQSIQTMMELISSEPQYASFKA